MGDEVAQEWVARQPAPALRPFIDQYYGYRLAGFAPGLHRGLPSPHLTFIVSIGPQIDVVEQTNTAQAPDSYRCVLAGLQTTPAVISHTGYQEGVAIELTPIGARALFWMPAGQLWDLALELETVAGPTGRELWERIQAAPTWDERFAACDLVLLRLLNGNDRADRPESQSVLGRCWDALVGSGGDVSITRLAEATGYSRQHLARLFKAEFGLSPKLAGRLARFHRARTLLLSVPPHVSIAQVAAICGYADHAHLCREFAEFAGCPPSQWLAEEDLPILQDTALTDG